MREENCYARERDQEEDNDNILPSLHNQSFANHQVLIKERFRVLLLGFLDGGISRLSLILSWWGLFWDGCFHRVDVFGH